GNQWLLIRGGNDLRGISKKLDDTSALSGKSMKQLSVNGKVWQSNRPETNGKSVFRSRRAQSQALEKNRPANSHSLKFIEPMKAKLVDSPPAGDWVYEIKFDGFRALAMKAGENVQLLSRNEKDLGAKFPEVAESVAGLKADDVIID